MMNTSFRLQKRSTAGLLDTVFGLINVLLRPFLGLLLLISLFLVNIHALFENFWIVLRCSTSRLDYLQLQRPLTHRAAGTAGLVCSEIPVGISHAAAKCKMNFSFRLPNTQVLDTGFGLIVLLWTFLGLLLLISRHSVSISTHWLRRNGPSMFHCATRLSSTPAAAHTSRRRDGRAGPQWSPP